MNNAPKSATGSQSAALTCFIAWCPVENSLPNEFEHVLVCIASEGEGTLITKGFHDGDDWHSDTFDKIYTTRHITHWAKLPEPPKQ